MNLARVEYYFADFLSCIESGEALELHDDPEIEAGVGAETEQLPIPRRLCVPQNLLFTGTVNVDETTSMFSPKVLDRAFTIEFNQVDLAGFGVPTPANSAATPFALAGLPTHLMLPKKISSDAWIAFGSLEGGALRQVIIALNDLLASEQRHFGYRVANEIGRFVNLAAAQVSPTPDALWIALDLALLAKALPKLYGTQQELETILTQLFAFAIFGASTTQPTPDAILTQWREQHGHIAAVAADGGSPPARLPRTAAKLWRMLRRLRQQGFTAFVSEEQVMSTPALQIRPRKGGEPPVEREGRIVLQGERSWIISGESAQIAAAAAALGQTCERVENTLLVSFGNMVGRITVPGLGLVEVVSGKWGEHHFEHMLADLAAVATELPFTADQPTGFPYDRSVLAREEVRYHLFVYLRHILSPAAPRDHQLPPALQAVLQQPLQRFESTRRNVPLAAAQRIDQRSLLRIAAGVDGLMRAGTTVAAHTPIAHALGGYLPRSVNERHITHSHDTLENRFVKSFLQLCIGIIEGMQRALEAAKTTDAFRLRIRTECAEMEKVLAPFVRHPFWEEVGPMLHLPTGSTVLQGRRGYREIYQHFVRLRLAAQIPLDERELRDLLEGKDIAQLYEIWCYFTMVRLLQELLGQPSRAERPKPTPLHMYVPHELEVCWVDGVRLRYNPRYKHGTGTGQSYSVPLRPDIALHIDRPTPRTYLFDAKFCLDQLSALLPNSPGGLADDEADEVAEERRGTFKRGDIYKMHTYRDALRGTGCVWVLYPGTESRFYSTDGLRLNLPVQTLPGTVEGVGAFALRPEDDGDMALCDVLKQLLGRS